MSPDPLFRILVLEWKWHINKFCIYVWNGVPAKVTMRQAPGPLGMLQSTLGARKIAWIDGIREDKVWKDKVHALRMRAMRDENRRGRHQELWEAEHHRARMERHRIEMRREERQLELLEIEKKIKLAHLAMLEKEAN